MKKKPRDIIILHKCTINHDYILYCSWDMVRDGCNCFSFWAAFCFYPSNSPKNLKKNEKKKWLEISSLYTSAPKLIIICYTVPEIWCMMDVIVIFRFGLFLPFYLCNSLKNENFQKNEKNLGDIIILQKCTKNHGYMLHCSWDIVCDRCNCFSF